MLVLHVDLLDTIKLTDLLHLRRQFPAVYWVLAWRKKSSQWVDLVVKFQARGCVDCDDIRSVPRAIDAVLSGDIWFPRWLTHALYAAVLSTIHVTPAETAMAGSGAALTQREAEAVELMRQGLTNKEIASRLQVSVNTVKKHLKHAFDKRGLHSRRQVLGSTTLACLSLFSLISEIFGLDFA